VAFEGQTTWINEHTSAHRAHTPALAHTWQGGQEKEESIGAQCGQQGGDNRGSERPIKVLSPTHACSKEACPCVGESDPNTLPNAPCAKEPCACVGKSNSSHRTAGNFWLPASVGEAFFWDRSPLLKKMAGILFFLHRNSVCFPVFSPRRSGYVGTKVPKVLFSTSNFYTCPFQK
jgi:hypothetical protein